MELTKKRKELGITQAQLAKCTGIGKRTIEAWESGERKLKPWLEKLIISYLEHEMSDKKVP